jgi:hypothetical protein
MTLVEIMGSECIVKHLTLSVSNIYIRVCGDEAEVGVSPLWDSIGRHEYVVVGTVGEVLNELRKLAEDIRVASKSIDDVVNDAGIRKEVQQKTE